jgi:N-methylhydantoinase B
MNTSMAVAELVIAAASRLAQREVADAGGVCGGMVMAGKRPDGGYFSTYELVGSAYGASRGKDGASGVSALLTNANAAPIEIMENEFPIRYRRWELIVDSGGVGAYRGGLGPVREYDILAPEAQMTLRGGKHAVPADGLAGGGPARLGDCIINPGSAATSLPSRFSGVALKGGDVVRLVKSGGGGLGPPRERAFERIVDDVIDGYVSRDAAISVYGADPAKLDAAVTEWNSTILITR